MRVFSPQLGRLILPSLFLPHFPHFLSNCILILHLVSYALSLSFFFSSLFTFPSLLSSCIPSLALHFPSRLTPCSFFPLPSVPILFRSLQILISPPPLSFLLLPPSTLFTGSHVMMLLRKRSGGGGGSGRGGKIDEKKGRLKNRSDQGRL